MIEVARDYCEKTGLQSIRPSTGSAEALTFEDGAFDTVISLDLLHHVESIDNVINETYRVLKPGGHFFVFEPNICCPLMFVAHALPPEERLAVKRNMPGRLVSLLERRFVSLKWEGVCDLITQTTGLKRTVLDTYLYVTRALGFQKLYPRQAWLGVKKDGRT